MLCKNCGIKVPDVDEHEQLAKCPDCLANYLREQNSKLQAQIEKAEMLNNIPFFMERKTKDVETQ